MLDTARPQSRPTNSCTRHLEIQLVVGGAAITGQSWIERKLSEPQVCEQLRGINLIIIIIIFISVLCVCVGVELDWKTHGSEYYECSRYKENPNIANESAHAQAREALKKYIFYFERV